MLGSICARGQLAFYGGLGQHAGISYQVLKSDDYLIECVAQNIMLGFGFDGDVKVPRGDLLRGTCGFLHIQLHLSVGLSHHPYLILRGYV